MKKLNKVWWLVIGVLLWGIKTICARESPNLPIESTETVKIELEKVWEMQFEEELQSVWGGLENPNALISKKYINQKIHSEKIHSGIVGKNVLTRKPMELSKESIDFFGKYFESQNGKYIGAIKCPVVDNIMFDTSFALFNENGKLIWEKDGLRIDRVFINNDGSAVVFRERRGVSPSAKYSFYDGSGNLIKKGEEIFDIRGQVLTL